VRREIKMSNEYTLADAIETARNVAIRHRGKSFKIIIDIAVAAVLERTKRGSLPKGWREHLEEAVEGEIE
jgi:uncharacterized membrane protein